ncbi:MAG: enoyl-CoA hydratase/isomerase family protein [Polyangiaceae bacterium]|nr:enoyl-CoA hydratase/isomerase family protein [Polyangiaceae bacterium]
MQARAYSTLLVAAADGVCTLTLNRPEKKNAIGSVMVNDLLYALEDAHADASVRVIVVTGAGDAFCAGGDFSQMTGGAEGEALPHKGDYRDLLLALWRATKPVIARVNGAALGGGLGIVAASTFAVASTSAKLGTPEVNVGLFPFMIAAVLERVMGRRALVRMMLLGERYDGARAAELGLVSEAVAPDELDAAVARTVSAVLDKSPRTLELGLRALSDTEELPLDEKLPILGDRLAECLATEDAREGLLAFLQRRKPVWTGR